MKPIYKILLQEEWDLFEKKGDFSGTPLDLKDGYIHLSTRDQVEGVISRFFDGIRPLIIVEFDSEEFYKMLKWEESSSGDTFPHLYGEPLRKELIKSTQIKI